MFSARNDVDQSLLNNEVKGTASNSSVIIEIKENPHEKRDRARRIRNFFRFLPERNFITDFCCSSDIIGRGCQTFVIHPCWIGSVFLSLGLGFGVTPITALGGMLLGISGIGGCVAWRFYKTYNSVFQETPLQLHKANDEQKKFIADAKAIGVDIQSGQTYAQVLQQLNQQVIRLEQEPKVISVFNDLDIENRGVSKASGQRVFNPNPLRNIILSYLFSTEQAQPDDQKNVTSSDESVEEEVLNQLFPINRPTR